MLSREEGELSRVVAIIWGKEPTGARADEFVVGEEEFGKELVGVWFVEGATGEAAFDAVFVVVVEAVKFSRAVFGQAVGIAFAGFVKNDELGGSGGLPGFAKVSPEAGFFDEVASAVVEIPSRFACDLGFADGRAGLSAERGSAAHGVRTRGQEDRKG